MKVYIFAVFDEKAECYTNPFFTRSSGLALRMFEDTVNDEKSTLHAHPEDFKLMRLGYVDDYSGKVVTEHEPVLLSHGSDYKFKRLQNESTAAANLAIAEASDG